MNEVVADPVAQLLLTLGRYETSAPYGVLEASNRLQVADDPITVLGGPGSDVVSRRFLVTHIILHHERRDVATLVRIGFPVALGTTFPVK